MGWHGRSSSWRIGVADAAAYETLVTQSGVILRVRQVGSADAKLIAEFYAALTPEDRRARFLATLASPDEAQVRADLDKSGSVGATFVALSEEGEPLAVAMLVPYADGSTGEAAIAVKSGRKGQGIGWTMLDHVRRYATSLGLLSLCSIESGDNRAALDLEREAGFSLVRDRENGGEVFAITSLLPHADVTRHD
jgi:acetyltransferase